MKVVSSGRGPVVEIGIPIAIAECDGNGMIDRDGLTPRREIVWREGMDYRCVGRTVSDSRGRTCAPDDIATFDNWRIL